MRGGSTTRERLGRDLRALLFGWVLRKRVLIESIPIQREEHRVPTRTGTCALGRERESAVGYVVGCEPTSSPEISVKRETPSTE